MRHLLALVLLSVGGMWLAPASTPVAAQNDRPGSAGAPAFRLEEATIGDIQRAIIARQITAAMLVQRYLERIRAYNGTCVAQPEGILGVITPLPNAGQINALQTLNLRPAARKALGFDDRKARSMTDAADNHPAMPDALETAADLDRRFAETGRLVGPLHGVVFAIKDQYETFDMRTTNGADAFYANDRPAADATLVKRLRNAGAIILAKSNMGEYASGDRSAFGGVFCNPYATDRSPGGSSGGSGTSVAANLVTCAIGEETGPSIRMPARFNNIVGLSPSQGLVSRNGMFGPGLNDRAGPLCRTVEDAARVLDVIAGYDSADELTAFAVGRGSAQPYVQFARERTLAGVRIGVLREYMDKSLFTEADHESIDIVDRAVGDLRKLGAVIVDPGPGAALFQPCIDRHVTETRNRLFVNQFPTLFPWDAAGRPATDHIPTLLELALNPSRFEETFADPSRRGERPSIRDFGPGNPVGERKWLYNRYLQKRGDPNIRSITDLIERANFYADARPGTRFADKRAELVAANADRTFDMRDRMHHWFAVQQIVLQCLAAQQLDAVVYPSGNVPPPILGAPVEPVRNGRAHQAWTMLGQQGFPAISVPAGFTTNVYDRVRDAAAPGGTRLVGPVPARLPVGVDFLARPFQEPLLLRIASAYEAATRHRTPPPAFGAVRGAS